VQYGFFVLADIVFIKQN